MKGKVLLAFAVLMVFTGIANAGAHFDQFNAIIDSAGEVTPGTRPNTGYNGGEWYYYPNTGWWNEWFYDDPPMPFPWHKVIDYAICIEGPGTVEIAINWSTMLYPEDPTMPPLPDLVLNDPALEDEWIVRDIVYSGPANGSVCGQIIIPDYNPEWVSIDIRGVDVEVWGCITHECIPEPATMSLLALGACLPLLRRKK